MGLALTAAGIYLPQSMRRSKLEELFQAAADAFHCPAPQLQNYSADEILEKFAVFTRENALIALKQGSTLEIKERLYFGACNMGRNIREKLKIRTISEVIQACRIIYKALKIDLHGDSQGHIQIKQCFFSAYYSADVCRVISSLDEGLTAGLSGGFKMEFTQRITEGDPCCKARLFINGDPG